jgi:hypothetical protein
MVAERPSGYAHDPDSDHLDGKVFGSFGPEMAAISGYLRQVTEILRKHTARHNAGGWLVCGGSGVIDAMGSSGP